MDQQSEPNREWGREILSAFGGSVNLSPADEYVIESTDREILQKAIGWLRIHGEAVSPDPLYPPELEDLAYMFLRMNKRKREYYIPVHGTALPPGTFLSAQRIMSEFCYCRIHERMHDGFFGHGVANGFYLKMLLRLEDLIQYHDAKKLCSADAEKDL